MTEHRQHPRKPIKLSVAFTPADGVRVEATCRDISLGGMFIETPAPSKYGAEVLVHLTFPGLLQGTDVKSIVRWTEKGVGMGVQFGTMGARETHALVELLHGT